MEVVINRIEEELVFIETEDGMVFGVPIEIFEFPEIGDIYIIKKIKPDEENINIFNFDSFNYE